VASATAKSLSLRTVRFALKGFTRCAIPSCHAVMADVPMGPDGRMRFILDALAAAAGRAEP
jgi:hypothetical protein